MQPAEPGPAPPDSLELPSAGEEAAVAPAAGLIWGERRFNLGDGMILVAATALGLGLGRLAMPVRAFLLPSWAPTLIVLFSGAIAWTPAMLVLRLRRPRPTLDQLIRQPGFVASLAAMATLGLGLIAGVVVAAARAIVVALDYRHRPLKSLHPNWWIEGLAHLAPSVGPAVIAAWLLLALSGRRQPARGWLDPLGRLMGVAWIILFVVSSGLRLAYLVD